MPWLWYFLYCAYFICEEEEAINDDKYVYSFQKNPFYRVCIKKLLIYIRSKYIELYKTQFNEKKQER